MTTKNEKDRQSLINAIGAVLKGYPRMTFQDVIETVFEGRAIPEDDKAAYKQIVKWMTEHSDS